MASQNDKARMREIAEKMNDLNRESLRESALLPRGRNIEVALELSALTMARVGEVPKPPKVSLSQLWRQRRR